LWQVEDNSTYIHYNSPTLLCGSQMDQWFFSLAMIWLKNCWVGIKQQSLTHSNDFTVKYPSVQVICDKLN